MSSSRKKLFIILGIALLVILVVLYLIIMASPRSTDDTGPRGIGNIFPFGDRGAQIDDDMDDDIVIIDEDRDQVVETIRDDRPPVFRISNRPVTAHNLFRDIYNVEVERINEEGETEVDIVEASDTLVMLSFTQDGEVARINLDAEEMREEILTQETALRGYDGYIAGEDGEYIVLRFLSPTSNTVETYIGTRDTQDAPQRLCREVIRDTLSIGSTGPQVSQLQEILAYRDHYDGEVNGIFSESTQAALISFQENSSIPQSGETGSLTREFLSNECSLIENELRQLRLEPRPVRGTFIRNDVYSLSLSPDRSTIFYTIQTNQGSRGFIMNLDERREIEIFTSPFSEWIGEWGSRDTITLHTAASGLVTGLAYTLSVETREFKRLIGDRTGLTVLQNPSGTHSLISEGNRGNAALSIHRAEDNTLASLDIPGFTEKCSWHDDRIAYCAIPNDLDDSLVYPDAWYRGIFKPVDSIWKIDAQAGTAEKIVDAIAFDGSGLDGVDIHISDEENYLTVRNRADNILWGVDLDYFASR